jgi:tripartite-type tricarboxylate transporter receptor subunit TctC
MKNRKREIRTSGSVRDEDGQHPHLLGRRKFLQLAAGAAALSSSPRRAQAIDYPAKPVRVIVPFAAGGSTDIAGRLICQWLSERTGQQFIVENRTGAGTNLGTELVVRAPPDGYTLLVVGATNTINVTLYEKLNFDFVRDITPVAGIVRSPLIMEVNASLPVNTVPEFIAYVKANPGKVNMASSGVGATPHMAGELFQWMAGIKMVHIPYRGDAPALADLLGGQVQVYFGGLAAAIDQIKAGKIRALAVSTAARLDVVPDVPAMNEYLPGYEASSWYGMGAPRATPPEIIDKLNKEINAGLADRKLVARFAELGLTVLPGTSSEFRGFIGDETEKWSKVVRASGARTD